MSAQQGLPARQGLAEPQPSLGELQIPEGRAPQTRARAGARPAGSCSPGGPDTAPGTGRTPTCLRCALSGPTEPGRVRSVGVGAGEKAVRAPGSAGSSGPQGGAAASARAALYPGEEAPRRHPVTPGPAGPSGLPPRHSLAPARRPIIATDLPADCQRSPQLTSKRPTDLCLPPPDNNKRPQGPAPRL